MNKYIKTALKLATLYIAVRRSGILDDLSEIKAEATPFLERAGIPTTLPKCRKGNQRG